MGEILQARKEVADAAKEANVYRDPGPISALAVRLAEGSPKLFSRFYPRIYENLGKYNSPKVLAAYLTEMVRASGADEVDKLPVAYRIMAPSLHALTQQKVPMFFLAPSFLDAIKATDFKEDIDWINLKLPFEQGVMVLPRGTLSAREGEIGFIYWSRVRAGVQYRSMIDYAPGLPGWLQVPHDSFVCTALLPDVGCWYDFCLSASHRPTLQLRNVFYREQGETLPPNHAGLSPFDEQLSEADSPLIEQLGVVLFGTFLAMNARPDLIEMGKCERVIKEKKDKPRREFWSPNVIGRRYVLKRERKETQGTHASPMMHWRRGHYRSQAFGVGRKERKTIWIEPILVGAGED